MTISLRVLLRHLPPEHARRPGPAQSARLTYHDRHMPTIAQQNTF